MGKWDCGAATPKHTPFGRNYSTALNYFGHGNYQWGMIEWGANGGGNGNNTVPPTTGHGLARDLWLDDKPAVALANRSRDDGIYEEDLFRERLTEIISAHDLDDPMFLVYAARIAHYPIQAPVAYQRLPHIAAIDVPHRMVYHAQIQYLDDQIGNLYVLFFGFFWADPARESKPCPFSHRRFPIAL